MAICQSYGSIINKERRREKLSLVNPKEKKAQNNDNIGKDKITMNAEELYGFIEKILIDGRSSEEMAREKKSDLKFTLSIATTFNVSMSGLAASLGFNHVAILYITIFAEMLCGAAILSIYVIGKNYIKRGN